MNVSRRGLVCRACSNSLYRPIQRQINSFPICWVKRGVFRSSLRLQKTTIGLVEADSVKCRAVGAISEAEREANEKRWEESGKKGNSDEWRWTLNWDDITDNIIVGSCPRSPEDLERIADEAGATAVLSLQCDLCLDALQIDWEAIREHAVEKGVVVARVPIRDFDHGDQTLMLPEAVRTLAMLLALGNKVYVHCTAGINRANLTVLGYLTFVKGWELNTALKMIKEKRPQAHPYVDCWKSTKARILQDRTDEVVAMAKLLSGQSDAKGDSFGNWVEAENQLIQETFRRQLGCSLSLVSSLTDIKAASFSSVCILPEEMDNAKQEIAELREDLNEERANLHRTLVSLEHGNAMTASFDQTLEDIEVDAPEICEGAFVELADAQSEIAALKQGLRDVAETSARALNGAENNVLQAVDVLEESGLKTKDSQLGDLTEDSVVDKTDSAADVVVQSSVEKNQLQGADVNEESIEKNQLQSAEVREESGVEKNELQTSVVIEEPRAEENELEAADVSKNALQAADVEQELQEAADAQRESRVFSQKELQSADAQEESRVFSEKELQAADAQEKRRVVFQKELQVAEEETRVFTQKELQAADAQDKALVFSQKELQAADAREESRVFTRKELQEAADAQEKPRVFTQQELQAADALEESLVFSQKELQATDAHEESRFFTQKELQEAADAQEEELVFSQKELQAADAQEESHVFTQEESHVFTQKELKAADAREESLVFSQEELQSADAQEESPVLSQKESHTAAEEEEESDTSISPTESITAKAKDSITVNGNGVVDPVTDIETTTDV